jgi:hypothetical protein
MGAILVNLELMDTLDSHVEVVAQAHSIGAVPPGTPVYDRRVRRERPTLNEDDLAKQRNDLRLNLTCTEKDANGSVIFVMLSRHREFSKLGRLVEPDWCVDWRAVKSMTTEYETENSA